MHKNKNRRAAASNRPTKEQEAKKAKEEERLRKEKEEEEERIKKEEEEEREREEQEKERQSKKKNNDKNKKSGKISDDEQYEEDDRYEAQDNGEEDEAYEEGEEEGEVDEDADDAEEDEENKYSDRDQDQEEDQEQEKEEDDYEENGYDREDTNERSNSGGYENDQGPSRKDVRSSNTFVTKSRATSKGRSSHISSKSWALQRAEEDNDDQEDEEDLKDLGADQGIVRGTDRFEDLTYEGKTVPPPEDPDPIQPQPRDSKRCEFFVNGEVARQPVIFTINKKTCRTFSALKSELTNKSKSKCELIFHIGTGQKVASLELIHHGERYAFGPKSIPKLIEVNYGSKYTNWSNRPISTKAGKIRNAEIGLLSKNPPPKQLIKKGQHRPPRLMTITSNVDRNIRAKVVINPNTSQLFEEVLAEMGSMVEVVGVCALYTTKEPFIRVKSFSHLFGDELRNEDNFLVCGEEEVPPELKLPKGMADEWIEKSKEPKPKKKDRDSGHSSISTLTEASSVHVGGRYTQNGFDPTPDEEIDDLAVRKNRKDTDVNKKNSEMVNSRRSLPQRSRDNETVRMYMKGRQKEFYVPRNMQTPPHDGSRPNKTPRLDWAYGYRGYDTANNMFVLRSGDLAYYTGTVGIVYNKKENSQMHYTGHTEDITCMAVHPERNIIATGQVGGTPQSSSMWWPHVRVWEAVKTEDSESLPTLHIIGLRTLMEGVSSLSFCGAGKGINLGDLLMVIDESDRHFMYVYKWEEGSDGMLVAKSPTTSSRHHTDLQPASDTVVWGHFHPESCTDIFTHGKNHVHVWKLLWNPKSKPEEGWKENGNRKVQKPIGKLLWDKKGGLFEDMPIFVTAMAFSNDDVIVGDWHGRITIFSRDDEDAYVINHDFEYAEMLYRAHCIHIKPIFALNVSVEGMLLSGAGNEIKAWACWDQESQYRPLKEFERKLPKGTGNVRTIAVSGDDVNEMVLFVGTTANCILETNLTGGRWNVLVQGHSSDLCALTVCPDNKSFITAGYDKQVIKWDSKRHKPHWKNEVYESATSITVDPDSLRVVVGTITGMFSVLDAEKGDHIFSYNAAQVAIDCIQYSPNGKLLAFGSRDCNVHIYREEGDLLVRYKKCILAGHKNFVKQLDWSEDGRTLQTASADLDLKYWKIDTMTEEKAFQHRDFAPDTQTCIVGHNVLGAWISLEDSEDILTISASRDESDEKRPMKILAVGNNKGALRLYQYPCVHPQPSYHERRWHSGQVTCARFMSDGTEEGEFLVTTGGEDSSIMQWNLETSPVSQKY